MDPADPPRSTPDFTEPEVEALRMADDLRDRVQREREVVRRIRAHLDGTWEVPALDQAGGAGQSDT